MTDERRDTVQDRLPDWVAGRLDPGEARRVGEAVEADEELAAEAAVLASALSARPAAPDGLAARIAAAAREDRAVPTVRTAPRGLRGRGLAHGRAPGWALAAAAVALVALGTLEMAERSVTAAADESPLERVALEDAPDPWVGDDVTVAGAPVLDGLSDEALSSLLEELGG